MRNTARKQEYVILKAISESDKPVKLGKLMIKVEELSKRSFNSPAFGRGPLPVSVVLEDMQDLKEVVYDNGYVLSKNGQAMLVNLEKDID